MSLLTGNDSVGNRIVIPQVFAQAVLDRLSVHLRASRLAFDFTSLVPDIRTFGEVMVFPRFANVPDIDAPVTKGVAIVPHDVEMEDMEARILQYATSIRVWDRDAQAVKGQTMNEAANNIARAFAKRFDGDLVRAIDTDAIFKVATSQPNAITLSEFYEAIGYFGDDIDTNTYAGILAHSSMLQSFLSMPEFVKVDFAFNQGNTNGIISDGVVGLLLGIPVIIANNETFDVTKNEAKTYILKKNALGYAFSQTMNVEQARRLELLAWDIQVQGMYACKLIEPRDAVVLRKTIV